MAPLKIEAKRTDDNTSIDALLAQAEAIKDNPDAILAKYAEVAVA